MLSRRLPSGSSTESQRVIPPILSDRDSGALSFSPFFSENWREGWAAIPSDVSSHADIASRPFQIPFLFLNFSRYLPVPAILACLDPLETHGRLSPLTLKWVPADRSGNIRGSLDNRPPSSRIAWIALPGSSGGAECTARVGNVFDR